MVFRVFTAKFDHHAHTLLAYTCVSMKADYFHIFFLLQLVVCTLRATSRGTITLKSSNPYDYPDIDPNYLDTDDDVRDLRAGVKLARQVSVAGLYVKNCSS